MVVRSCSVLCVASTTSGLYLWFILLALTFETVGIYYLPYTLTRERSRLPNSGQGWVPIFGLDREPVGFTKDSLSFDLNSRCTCGGDSGQLSRTHGGKGVKYLPSGYRRWYRFRGVHRRIHTDFTSEKAKAMGYYFGSVSLPGTPVFPTNQAAGS